MNIKKGCNLANISPQIMYACGVIETLYKARYQRCVFTSFTEGTHGTASLHPKGMAVDIRTYTLTAGEGDSLFAEIKHALDPLGFDTVDERGGKTGGHFHVEWDPKVGEKWLTEVP